MLEFLVLGKIPGTDLVLTIGAIINILGLLTVTTLLYFLFRTRVTRLVYDLQELMTIELISL